MSEKVNLAFIGLGWWSNVLANAALESARINIAACHSNTEAKMQAFVNKYGGRIIKKYQDVLADPGIDAVILTTPNSFHAPQAILAAENKKHIFVEKPMALSVIDCQRMISAAKKNNVILAVGQNARRTARFRKMRELIKSGAIGQIVLVEANSSDDLGLRLPEQSWRKSSAECPGGPLTSFTVHHADTFNYLVGPVKRISAFIGKVYGQNETDDMISATLEFESGALGYLGGSFITPERSFLHIHGVEGIADVDEGCTYYQKKGTTKREPILCSDLDIQKKEALAEEIDEFAACIQTGKKPEVAGEEGLAAVAIIEAIIKSARSGLPVEISSLIQDSTSLEDR
jgi:predicted dehydrogenase